MRAPAPAPAASMLLAASARSSLPARAPAALPLSCLPCPLLTLRGSRPLACTCSPWLVACACGPRLAAHGPHSACSRLVVAALGSRSRLTASCLPSSCSATAAPALPATATRAFPAHPPRPTARACGPPPPALLCRCRCRRAVGLACSSCAGGLALWPQAHSLPAPRSRPCRCAPACPCCACHHHCPLACPCCACHHCPRSPAVVLPTLSPHGTGGGIM
jgi:hypothetical protein